MADGNAVSFRLFAPYAVRAKSVMTSIGAGNAENEHASALRVR
jgi:hypothetical protein